MGGEAVRADLGATFEARHHHEPADRPLQPAEDDQRREPPAETARNGALYGNPADPEEDEAEHAAEQPVHPFPEEDELEARQGHAGRARNLAILRSLPIELERVLP